MDSKNAMEAHTNVNFSPPNQSPLSKPDPIIQQAIAQQAAELSYITRKLQDVTLKQEQFKAQLDWMQESDRVLHEITQLIQQSIDIQKTFQVIVQHIQTFLKSDRVCIYQLHKDWSSSAVVECVMPPYPSQLGYVICDQLTSDQTAIQANLQGQASLINDIRTASQDNVDTVGSYQTIAINSSTVKLLEFFQIQARLAVPIFREQDLWGLLAVHQCSVPRQWQEREVQFLRRLAVLLGMAVERARLRKQVHQLQADVGYQAQEHTIRLQQTLEFEAKLKRITDHVRDSLDENQILQTAVQELASVAEIQFCQAVLCNLEEPTQSNCDREYTALSLSDLPPTDRFQAFSALSQQLQQGQFCQFCPTEPFLNPGQSAIFACPIFDDQGYLGSLRLYARRSHIFDGQEERLVQQVASYCAIALRQARLYQAAHTQVKELERLNQLKDDFLSTVSHELRTPLSSIKMVTNLLKIILSKAPENALPSFLEERANKVKQYLKVLEDECDREIILINDLLATQHLNAGVHPLSLGTICLEDWTSHIVETFQHRAQMNQQTLTINLAENLPPLVSDSFILTRILVELLNNACKYTPENGKISLDITIEASQFQLTVQNSGVTISPKELSRVFDPFYRIPNHDPWKKGGTGLGLSLTKKLVEYLGGTITVKSASEQVCFIIALPFVSS
ncbi:GAF domain-containing protein [Leptolyngbyaceae cyanobacterium UHCC 1019]